MSLEKAIFNKKEKRKQYYDSRRFACSCRNHGSCEWCIGKRLYQLKKERERTKQCLEEYYGM